VTTIAVDGLNEEIFRRSIESRLRQGKAGEAVAKLRTLIEPYAGPGRILPERFLTVDVDDLALHGWEGLGESIRRHDRPGRPVTAVSISFGWAGEAVPEPDANGHLSPHIETGYFTDDAFPFSQSGRDDLLDGYSWHGCTWADESEATDTVLSLTGIDDLHGALAMLESRLLASDTPDEEGIRAGSLGACLLSALLFQAVNNRIAKDGLPRPVCVLSGSNGVYPYFDAPVVGIPDDVLKAADDEDEAPKATLGVPAPRYSSLLMTGIPRARKRAVLVVDESEEETAQRIAALRSLNHRDESAEPHEAEAAFDAGPPVDQTGEDIVPTADGPLLAKKHGSHNWDFRDMLGPRDPESALAAGDPDEGADPPAPRFPAYRASPPPDSLVEDAAPAVPLAPEPGDLPPPVAPVAADPVDEIAPVAEPDIAAEPAPAVSREPSVQERLQWLVSPPEAPSEESVQQPEPTELTQWPAAPDTLGPVWPLGLGWLEDDHSPALRAPAEYDDDQPAERPGLWSRLRAWFGRSR
jgi:hypothetical protein